MVWTFVEPRKLISDGVSPSSVPSLQAPYASVSAGVLIVVVTALEELMTPPLKAKKAKPVYETGGGDVGGGESVTGELYVPPAAEQTSPVKAKTLCPGVNGKT